jgi:predicted porin
MKKSFVSPDLSGNEPISLKRLDRGELKVKKSILHAAIFASIATAGFANVAHAADDGSLTWNGITFYGVVDIGVAYQTHGAPLSQDWGNGLQYLIAKSSNKSITSVAPNGLSQSRLGVKGKEDLTDSLAFVFNAEMGFDPQSGNLADGPKALTHNNGVALANQTSAGDSSRAGQFFNGQIYGGLSSKDWGTLTLGRQNSILTDTDTKYDPMNGSYAFSVLGTSGTTVGGGDTQDARLDNSVKYLFKHDWFHAGAMYQFGKTDSSPGEAWQGDVGFDYAGFAVDGVYAKKKDAISASSLSAAQVLVQPADSLVATISDNEAWTIAGSYTAGPWKVSAGYEDIDYKNPSLPITAPFTGLGGYYMSVVNNAAFPRTKNLDVSWVGVKYLFTPDFDITGAYYHYDQNSYAATKCSTTAAGSCSGSLSAFSVRLDYRFNKRFDVYGGVMYSEVEDGLASGYLNKNTSDPMVGFRFQF